MFENFDFSVLEDSHYKEDAVREDLIAPLLRYLGYKESGDQRVQRSQSLTHPYVLIGSQSRKINIVPDYTLFYKSEAILIIDAKNPFESIIKSKHVEQAFSYAIHPDIRTKSYALCNGRELVLYDIDRSAPVFQIKMEELDKCINEVRKHLSPEALLNHHHRSFQPDLGIFLKNANFDQFQKITFTNIRILALGLTLDNILTASASVGLDENDSAAGYLGSFDLPIDMLEKILSCIPDFANIVTNALAKPCSYVWVGGVISVDWTFCLGKETVGLFEHDPLIPLIVTEILNVSKTEALGPPSDGIPPDILYLPTLLKFSNN